MNSLISLLQQPPDQDELFELEMKELESNPIDEVKPEPKEIEKQEPKQPIQLLKFIRKIWER